MKKRILAGMRSSGKLHLGNYLGGVEGMLALQNDPDYETFYMVADLHAITTPYDKKTLAKNSREVVIDYLAAGLDPSKSTIFIQSHVPEHIELAYLFSTVISLARLIHLPTYKEKVKQYPNASTIALIYYPVLMASDILLYKASLVPVGIDQEPHLEITREIARKMNEAYGTDFPEPKRFATKGEYIPSLTGVGKMSKSVEGSFINLTDDLETIKAKLAKVPTDSGQGTIENLEETKTHSAGRMYRSKDGKEAGGVDALLRFIELFEGIEKRKKYDRQYMGKGLKYSQIKSDLAEAIYKEIEPIQKRRKELEKDSDYIERILKEGAQKARKIAQKTVDEVKEKMGLR